MQLVGCTSCGAETLHVVNSMVHYTIVTMVGKGSTDVVCALYDSMTGSGAELLRMYRNYNKVGVGKLTKTN